MGEKIICSCCGYAVSTSQKFCPECGAPLEKIPLGLMLSGIVTNKGPMMAVGYAGVLLDGSSLSVSITYADGKRDQKIPDGEMIRALNELMKRVFMR